MMFIISGATTHVYWLISHLNTRGLWNFLYRFCTGLDRILTTWGTWHFIRGMAIWVDFFELTWVPYIQLLIDEGNGSEGLYSVDW